MHDADLRRPLNQPETREWSEFLVGVPGALPYWQAHGFLTAIGSAPTTLLPSVWQPVLLGQCEFASREQANHIFGLVFRLYNQILTDLSNGNPTVPRDSDGDLASWCEGYLTAARMDDAWTGDEEGMVLLFPMAVLTGEVSLVGEQDADGGIIEDPTPQLQRCRELLGKTVREANDYWAAWRRANMAVPTASRPPKIGRNEPCPCGSGRKFKKCCALTMH